MMTFCSQLITDFQLPLWCGHIKDRTG